MDFVWICQQLNGVVIGARATRADAVESWGLTLEGTGKAVTFTTVQQSTKVKVDGELVGYIICERIPASPAPLTT